MKTRYRNVYLEPDRHGKIRARFRKSGRKPVYMRRLPDQEGFEEELKALRDDAPLIETKRALPNSVSALVPRYYASAAFKRKSGLDDQTRRRGLLESFRAECGDDIVGEFTFEHIEAILIARTQKRTNERGRMVGGQVAATNLRKELNRFFAFAKKLKWISNNPVEEADPVGQRRLTGWHTWTEEEIKRYKRRHPIGTKARLALEIILWTLMRRGDARQFGPKHVINGKVHFKASKNQMDLWLPMAPDLRAAIDAMASVGIATYLVNEYGKPFTKDGFGNKMRQWCNEADLQHCSAHGLRKATARRMAASQATQVQMKAAGGWRNDEEVKIYTEAAGQEDMANAGLTKVISQFSNQSDD
jgi:integrase